jgi:membrane fusion protein (multidrug efflux system)
MKSYAIAIGLIVVIFGTIGGLLYKRFAGFAAMDFSPPPVTIAASTATREQWRNKLSAVGSIEAVRGVELRSETSGEITALHFDSGDVVKVDQLLLVLNDEVERASQENQVASLELAQILFDRDSELIKQKTIPQSQYDQSRADLQRAKAQLAETAARLSNKKMEAPFAGTLGIRQIDVGDYLSTGVTITTLQDYSELEIDFTLPARHAPKLRAGLNIAVTVDAFPDRSFTAIVTAVDSRIDPGTRNILLRARLDDSAGLLPGMFATLSVDLGDARSVVTIPETAMTYALQGNTVYVIEEAQDGGMTATARVVEAGPVRNSRVAVYSGLEDGERIVSVGQNKLYRGVKVLIDEDVQL